MDICRPKNLSSCIQPLRPCPIKIRISQILIMSVSPITCHILDTAIGKPAANVTCSLYYMAPEIDNPVNELAYELGSGTLFAMAKTDADGRIKNWVYDPQLSSENQAKVGLKQNQHTDLKPGVYKIKFLTGKYFAQLADNSRSFFPFVEIYFKIDNPPDHHYHIPLLLSNFSYTTYRGS